MIIYDNASKIRARKRSWMRTPCFKWWLMFTGAWFDFAPKFFLFAPSYGSSLVSLGFCQMSMDQCPNAPSYPFYKAM